MKKLKLKNKTRIVTNYKKKLNMVDIPDCYDKYSKLD